jgi:hypothetical protein
MCCCSCCTNSKFHGKIAVVFGVLAFLFSVILMSSVNTLLSNVICVLEKAMALSEMGGFGGGLGGIGAIEPILAQVQALMPVSIIPGLVVFVCYAIAAFGAMKENPSAGKGGAGCGIFFTLLGIIIALVLAIVGMAVTAFFSEPGVQQAIAYVCEIYLLLIEQTLQQFKDYGDCAAYGICEYITLLEEMYTLMSEMCVCLEAILPSANSVMIMGFLSIIVMFFSSIVGCSVCSAFKMEAKKVSAA